MTSSRPSGPLLLVALFLAALALRLVNLDRASFWLDEALQTNCASLHLWQIWGCHPPDKPPLDYYLQWPFMLLGHSEFNARLHAALIGAGFVVAMAWWGSIVGGRRLAVLCAGLSFALPVAVRYSQEVRPYALMLTTEVLFLALLTRVFWTRQPAGRRHWVLLALAMTAHLWSLFMAWEIVILAALFAAGVAAIRPGKNPQAAALPTRAQRLAVAGLFALGVGSALIPLARAGRYATPKSMPWDVTNLGERVLQYLQIHAGGYDWWQYNPSLLPWLVGPFLLGVAGIRSRDRCVRIVTAFCLVAGVGIYIAAFAFAWSIDHWMEMRYTLPALPPLLMIVALGAERLARLAAKTVRPRQAPRAVRVATASLAAFFALLAAHWVLLNPVERTDWRGLAAALKGPPPGASVLLADGLPTAALEYYFWREGVAAKARSADSIAHPVAALLATEGPAWIVTAATPGESAAQFSAAVGRDETPFFGLRLLRADDPSREPRRVVALQENALTRERPTITLKAADGLAPNLGRGWYRLEVWPDGTAVRAAAEGCGELLLHLDEPRAVRMKFSAISHEITRDPPRTLAFEVNGQQVAVRNLKEQWEWVDQLLPAEHFKAGVNRIVLRANRAYVPAEENEESGDQRALSFYFSQIELIAE